MAQFSESQSRYSEMLWETDYRIGSVLSNSSIKWANTSFLSCLFVLRVLGKDCWQEDFLTCCRSNFIAMKPLEIKEAAHLSQYGLPLIVNVALLPLWSMHSIIYYYWLNWWPWSDEETKVSYIDFRSFFRSTSMTKEGFWPCDYYMKSATSIGLRSLMYLFSIPLELPVFLGLDIDFKWITLLFGDTLSDCFCLGIRLGSRFSLLKSIFIRRVYSPCF